jgi:hypothetical protein
MPVSPVRTRTASLVSMTKILPSPLLPVFRTSVMTSMTCGTSQIFTTTSTRILSRNLTLLGASSVLEPLVRPIPFDFRTRSFLHQFLFVQGIRQVLQGVGPYDDRDHLHAVRLQDGGEEQVEEPDQTPAARDIEEYLGFQLRIRVTDGVEVNNPPAHQHVQDQVHRTESGNA